MIEVPQETVARGDWIARIAIRTGVAILSSAGALAVVLLLVRRGEWWSGLGAATVISILAAGASVGPMGWGLSRGLQAAVGGYFVSAGIRMVVSLGGGLLAVMVGGYPALPTMVLMVVMYLAVLGAETWVVVRAIWGAKL